MENGGGGVRETLSISQTNLFEKKINDWVEKEPQNEDDDGVVSLGVNDYPHTQESSLYQSSLSEAPSLEQHIRLDERTKRDAEWRAHEMSQIKFLQEHNSLMFSHLNFEIEKLNSIIRIYQFKLEDSNAKNIILNQQLNLLETEIKKSADKCIEKAEKL
uniref:Uncharacterized protein n=1 Tax=Rhabditophanes sp. KR3021 TaxID=114890 RepID=A0AC35U159_9BILA